MTTPGTGASEREEKLQGEVDRLSERVASLSAQLLTAEGRLAELAVPEVHDFLAGVAKEAAYQRQRWGADGDAGKTALDWYWLAGKVVHHAETNREKALHHAVSTAAALANWHAALTGTSTEMRPGTAHRA